MTKQNDESLNRDSIEALKRSRAGFKVVLTKRSKPAIAAINEYVSDPDDPEAFSVDPFVLEGYMKAWKKAFERYEEADNLVSMHELYEPGDDKGFAEKMDTFLKYEAEVRTIRLNFEQRSASKVQAQGHSQHVVPDVRLSSQFLSVHQPPSLEEDTDVRAFWHWRPLWDNFIRRAELRGTDEATQCSIFWDCLSPGFFQTVHRSIGLNPKTSCPVDEILDAIDKFLRGRRNEYLDLRDLLGIRQTQGEDYTGFFNRMHELASYAEAQKITEDRLLIGLTLQGISNEGERTRLMNKKPGTFEEAKAFLFEQESSRKGSKSFSSSHQPGAIAVEVGAAKSSYQKNKARNRVNNQHSKSSDGHHQPSKSKCSFCGREDQHPRDKCPAKSSTCRSCKKQGHWHVVCRQKGLVQNQQQNALHCASLIAGPKRSNVVEIGVIAGGYGDCLPISFVVDSGADLTIMDLQTYHSSGLVDQVNEEPVRKDTVIRDAGSGVLKQRCSFIADLKIENQCIQDHRIFVCEGIKRAYLSLDACCELNIIGKRFPKPYIISSSVSSSSDSLEAVDWISGLPDQPSEAEIVNVDAHIRSLYKDVFATSSSKLKTMSGHIVGDPMVITLKEGAKPFAIHSARMTPFAVRDALKKELDSLIAQSIIAPVGNTPTEWCHPIVVVPKPDGSIRLCVDLTKLNTEVIRSVHPIKTSAEAISGLKVSQKYFAKLDLAKGYWQMPLAEESQHLTTFITEFGKFKFLRSPMGFVSTGDSYSFRGDAAMAGLDVQKVIDDMACGHESFQGLVKLVCQVLDRCRLHNLTVNSKKSVFAATSISFVGYKISQGSIEADPELVAGIQKFPTPSTCQDLCSFMGLVNQLGKFSSGIAAAAETLRPLLSIKNEFVWMPDHDIAFDKVKKLLVSPPVLGMFQLNSRTVLQTDASRKFGLGYALLQYQDNGWRLIQCNSQFLSPAESRYAMVELEALAILWAIRKCHLFLAGLPQFVVLTDHRPLCSLFNSQAMNAIDNIKIQAYRMNLMGYNFVVEWQKGSQHAIPDALSRAPVSDPGPDDHIHIAGLHIQDEDLCYETLAKAAIVSEDYKALKQAIVEDTVARTSTGYVALFKKLQKELSIDKDLIFLNMQVVVPPLSVPDVLKILHRGHQGVEKTKLRARQSVFWPGMSSDINNMVQSCPDCAAFRPSLQREPLEQDVPARPFDLISSDLFQLHGKYYLTISDLYSGFPFISKFAKAPASADVVKVFKKIFSLCGIPRVVWSDKGPQYDAALFQDFLSAYGVKWRPSSPFYPQSNGHAEVSVKIIKHLLAKTGGNIDSDAFQDGLLDLRCSPREDGLSPAQRFFGRQLRSLLPSHPKVLDLPSTCSLDVANGQWSHVKRRQKTHYDNHSKLLAVLPVGTRVHIQNVRSKRWDREGVILHMARRSIKIRSSDGAVFWRNRRFVRAI